MVESKFLGFEHHALYTEFFGKFIIVIDISIEIIANDCMTGSVKVYANLVMATGLRAGFNDG